ncbi:MAG: hypothetical protein HC845_13235 [Akkermansiaceae bacterium]|nr:hypothetical protein [Akkermansiaceae bacterium]
MPKFSLFIAASGFIFLTACEPLELPEPSEYRRPRPSRYLDGDFQRESERESRQFSENEETERQPEFREEARSEEEVEDQEPDPPIQPPARPGRNAKEYPVAERTANPNQVRSPYEPYNVIDVEGFTSGQLARDPSNQKIFRVP